MLQNSRVTAFTVFELLRENQLAGGKITPFPLPRLGIIENNATTVYSPEENETILSSTSFIRTVEEKVSFYFRN